MRNQRRLRTAAVFAALAVTGLGACGRSDNTTQTTAAGPDAPGTTEEVDKSAEAANNPGPGFDGKTITVGLLTVTSGAVSAIGIPMSDGFDTYFKRINEAGGIAGKYPVTAKRYDTKYTPQDAIQQYDLSKGEVAMYGQIIGTTVVNGVKDRLTDDGVLGQPATLDAYWTHEEALMPFGAPYQVQAINGFDWAVRTKGAKDKTVCSMTKTDDYGKAGLEGYKFAVQKLGLKAGPEVTFESGQDMTAPISTLKNGNCAFVLFTGLSPDSKGATDAAATAGFEPAWLALSASWSPNTLIGAPGNPPSPNTGYLEKNFFLLAEGVNWGDTTNAAMKQQMADVQKYKPEQQPNGYFTFGWNEAHAVHQVLEAAAKSGDLTQSGILTASHKIPKLTFMGGYGEYKYGPPAERMFTPQTTVFGIKRDSPNGTFVVEGNFQSAAAKEYKPA
jgi:ABC-type branched-subunit amino acid transport system substrate-binding protein